MPFPTAHQATPRLNHFAKEPAMKFAHRLAVICAALVLAATSASAQIPDKFTNLKVLPKDTPKPELVKIMRGFAGDLVFAAGTATTPRTRKTSRASTSHPTRSPKKKSRAT